MQCISFAAEEENSVSFLMWDNIEKFDVFYIKKCIRYHLSIVLSLEDFSD